MTGAELRMTWPHFFPGRHNTSDAWSEKKKHKTHWYKAVGSALNFPFVKDVSQDCFAFEAVKFKSGGSLAVFCFEAVKVHFVRKSRRSALFWKCQFPLLTEVVQNCLLSGTNIDRSIDR